jgi:ATP-dependent RNA/DNA helicase IGHMBP2
MNNQRYEQLLQALHIERDFERKQHEILLKNTPVQTRVKLGYTWFPLRVVETGFGLGDYPFIIFERTKAKGETHKLSGGKPAILFSEEHNAPKPLQVAIQYVDKDQIKVICFLDDFPELLDYARLGLNLMVDESIYKEMEDALKRTMTARNNRLAYLRTYFSKTEKILTSNFGNENLVEASHLNESQQQAVAGILSNEDAFIVHGPPGTGKTTTIVSAAKALAVKGEKILMCATSNAASDWLVTKCVQAGLKTLRIGNLSRIEPVLVQHTIEGMVEAHPDYKTIKNHKKRADELRRMASKYKRNFGYDEREQRRLLRKEARIYAEESIQLENQIIQSAIQSSQVIVSTLTGSASRWLEKIDFDTLFIDEAAQALEPACWIAIAKADKVIFAGDPFQLPPTVKSSDALKLGLGETLMERLMLEKTVAQAMLKTQYRMNKLIMNFSNEWFYNHQLNADQSVSDGSLFGLDILKFIDTAGCGFQEEWNEDTLSYANSGEINLVKMLLEQKIAHVQEDISVGIIAPYKNQVTELKIQLEESIQALPENIQCSVQTIDSFQGQERDVMIISLVRSNEKCEIGFLKDYRRMNVALTRAKKSLLVIVDSATIGSDDFYQKFITYCENIDAYESAWNYL